MLLLTVINKSRFVNRLANPEKLLNKSKFSSVIILKFRFIVKLSNSSYINELTKDFVKSVSELGVEITDDFNKLEQRGVGFYQFMNSKGKRSSAATSFIDPEI